MDECNSIKHDFHKAPNIYPNLSANISNEQQLRLNKINEIKDYLLTEIRERELISKSLSKYIVSFECFSKSLIFLSVVANSISIASSVSLIGAPAGIIGSKLWSYIFIYIRICKKVFKNKK